jgi:hypothetical protein
VRDGRLDDRGVDIRLLVIRRGKNEARNFFKKRRLISYSGATRAGPASLTFDDDLLAGAFKNGEKIFLHVGRDLKRIERSFEIANGCIELSPGDLHFKMSRL